MLVDANGDNSTSKDQIKTYQFSVNQLVEVGSSPDHPKAGCNQNRAKELRIRGFEGSSGQSVSQSVS